MEKKKATGDIGPIPLVVFITLLIAPLMVFADESLPPWEAPIFLKPVIDMVIGLPYIGPVLYEVLLWSGVAAAALTAISAGIAGIAKALVAAGKAADKPEFAKKVQEIYEKVFPIVAWFSMLNVQKPNKEKK